MPRFDPKIGFDRTDRLQRHGCFTQAGHVVWDLHYQQLRGVWRLWATTVELESGKVHHCSWDSSGKNCSLPEVPDLDPTSICKPVRRIKGERFKHKDKP